MNEVAEFARLHAIWSRDETLSQELRAYHRRQVVAWAKFIEEARRRGVQS